MIGWLNRRGNRILTAFLVVWQLGLVALLAVAGRRDRTLGVMAGMMAALSVGWIGGCGLVSLFGRDVVRGVAARLPLGPGGRFVALATFLALVEEAIATLITRSAPLLGARVGEVYITASADYLDVVAFHSVVVFVPQFAAWAWLLGRYRFRAMSVFWLYGLTGFLNESFFGGLQPWSLAQWVLTYGLMVFLPAWCDPDRPGRRPVCWWHYPVALILPILWAVPVVWMLLGVVAPGHPREHFPPIGSG